MQYQVQTSYGRGGAAASASVDDRAGFIVRTYLHLVGAIFAFVFLEAFYFAHLPFMPMSIAEGIAGFVLAGPLGNLGWLGVMVAFIGVSYLANAWARSGSSPLMQYAGLGLYVLAESVIFVPLLFLASLYDPQAIPTAGLVTLVLFGGLTGIVFLTRKDFSFLRGILGVGMLAAFAVAVAALLFGFSLGVFYAGAMVALMAGYILYDTSRVMLHYRTDQHVAAALALFASVALMFWYVLRIFLGSNRR